MMKSYTLRPGRGRNIRNSFKLFCWTDGAWLTYCNKVDNCDASYILVTLLYSPLLPSLTPFFFKFPLSSSHFSSMSASIAFFLFPPFSPQKVSCTTTLVTTRWRSTWRGCPPWWGAWCYSLCHWCTAAPRKASRARHRTPAPTTCCPQPWRRAAPTGTCCPATLMWRRTFE